MTDIFKDILPSILQTKKDCLEEEKDYKPYMVNRALSFHMDCVLYANQMNMNPHIDPKLQFDFLLNSIRPYKRPFQKWIKKETIEDLELVQEYFNYSEEKARHALSILSSSDLEIIRKRSDKGGPDVRTKSIHRGKAKGTG